MRDISVVVDGEDHRRKASSSDISVLDGDLGREDGSGDRVVEDSGVRAEANDNISRFSLVERERGSTDYRVQPTGGESYVDDSLLMFGEALGLCVELTVKMLAVFDRTVAKSPEGLRAPAAEGGEGGGRLVSHFAAAREGAVVVSLGSAGAIAYTSEKQNPLLPR
ncbi:hypothetical protein B296_00058537 [Ensete ventricosum]|uniref:DUF3700 domain-containing protein n=1 Tax=Ensete ventricosum TaxID=4639 RepID=A0A426X4H6_ENSVE|nr:hypothetical protein B296_00058537 [Ensete ventricosum]